MVPSLISWATASDCLRKWMELWSVIYRHECLTPISTLTVIRDIVVGFHFVRFGFFCDSSYVMIFVSLSPKTKRRPRQCWTLRWKGSSASSSPFAQLPFVCCIYSQSLYNSHTQPPDKPSLKARRQYRVAGPSEVRIDSAGISDGRIQQWQC